MKKNIIVALLAVLVLLAGCGQNIDVRPEERIEEFFQAVVEFDFDSMNEQMTPGLNLSTKQLLKSDAVDLEQAEVLDVIRSNAAATQYRIDYINDSGKQSLARLIVSYVDLGEALERAMEFNESGAGVAEVFVKYANDEAYKTIKETDITLQLANRSVVEWLIMDFDRKLKDVVTCGIASKLE